MYDWNAQQLKPLLFSLAFASFPNGASADVVYQEQLAPQVPAHCGTQYAPPFAMRSDAGPRVCAKPVPRNYTPKHHGIGFDVLNQESEACFVPDESYRLLDQIVDQVSTRISLKQPTDRASKVAQVVEVSRTTGEVLANLGFGLYIYTDTLGDGLTYRNKPDESPRHIFDCDIGSLILMTVADAFSLVASLVDITLPSGSGHNYVRWEVDQDTWVDWDTNGRGLCTTPSNLPSYEGKSMTHTQTMGYTLGVRALAWERQQKFADAVADYRAAMRNYPEAPTAYNNLAWLVATKDFRDRNLYLGEAIDAAERAVGISRSPNHLDTLACIYAYAGRFDLATRYENEALAVNPNNSDFIARARLFAAPVPKDCTGAS
jgi:tetratricopeptide (TPR) repeat protein